MQGTFIVFPTLEPFAAPAPLRSLPVDTLEAHRILGANRNERIYRDPDPFRARKTGACFRLNLSYQVVQGEGPVSSFALGAVGIREGTERVHARRPRAAEGRGLRNRLRRRAAHAAESRGAAGRQPGAVPGRLLGAAHVLSGGALVGLRPERGLRHGGLRGGKPGRPLPDRARAGPASAARRRGGCGRAGRRQRQSESRRAASVAHAERRAGTRSRGRVKRSPERGGGGLPSRSEHPGRRVHRRLRRAETRARCRSRATTGEEGAPRPLPTAPTMCFLRCSRPATRRR